MTKLSLIKPPPNKPGKDYPSTFNAFQYLLGYLSGKQQRYE